MKEALLVIILIGAISLAGCGKKEKTVSIANPDGTKTTTVTSPDGSQTTTITSPDGKVMSVRKK